MNIIFDLGGVVVRWEPEALLARTFDDPAIYRVLYAEFLGHPDWLEFDEERGAGRCGGPGGTTHRFAII